MKILVTGSEGLVGTELCKQLRAAGHETVPFDIKLSKHQDVKTNYGPVTIATTVKEHEVDGIVHLAAMVRVAECEKNTVDAIEVNTGGVIAAVRAAGSVLPGKKMPWVLFTSSREVYGNTGGDLVRESYPVSPVNVYGRTKALGEDVIHEARRRWVRAAIVRLSSVYGSTKDHTTRVVPAFARAAAKGSEISLAGRGKYFDFVHVTDAARGLVTVCELLEQVHPSQFQVTKELDVHLVTGKMTTLAELADRASGMAAVAGKEVQVNDKPAASHEVLSFVGDPTKARTMLGWQANVSISHGFRKLVDDYAALEVVQ